MLTSTGPGVAFGNVTVIDTNHVDARGSGGYNNTLSYELGHINDQNQSGVAYLPTHILSQGVHIITGLISRSGRTCSSAFFENEPVLVV